MARQKELEPLLYERIEGETPKQWEAFKKYRDMGLTRNLRTVAKELNKSLALIGRWSSANDWVDRVAEYDRDMDKQEILESIKKRKEMVRRHAQVSKMFQNKILERMQRLNSAELSPGDLSRWFEMAVKIERLSMGEATEIQNGALQHTGRDGGAIETRNMEGLDLSKLSDKELENLENIISKAGEDDTE